MKKLKIFTFPDRNPEYLQLQIDSYKLYMQDADTELIVVNASTNNADEIDNICKNNNIECIKYIGPNNGFITYYVEQLNWFRDTMQKNISDYILLIHSDMFFINKLDYKSLMDNKKIIINPQYRLNNSLYYMWDGVLLFDSEFFNSNNLTKLFIWNPVEGISDMGGQTSELLKKIDKNDIGFFEFWNIYDIINNNFDTHLNGNIRYSFDMNNKKLHLLGGDRFSDKKSFPYENDIENYEEYYINNFFKLKELFIDNYDFLNPIHIDIIQSIDTDITKSPIIHFKSGTGYQNFYNPIYANHKLEQIKKIIFRDLN